MMLQVKKAAVKVFRGCSFSVLMAVGCIAEIIVNDIGDCLWW